MSKELSVLLMVGALILWYVVAAALGLIGEDMGCADQRVSECPGPGSLRIISPRPVQSETLRVFGGEVETYPRIALLALQERITAMIRHSVCCVRLISL